MANRMRHRDQRVREYAQAHRLSGGPLPMPRTAAQKILLQAKHIRLKRETQRRLGEP